jgi:transcriptional regulator with XRE-family HTH domain
MAGRPITILGSLVGRILRPGRLLSLFYQIGKRRSSDFFHLGIRRLCMRICERIRLAREAAGIKKIDLAATLDVAPATITRWESGDREPRQAQLERIADALGVSQAALWAEAEPIATSQEWVRLRVVGCHHQPQLEDKYVMLPPHLVAGLTPIALLIHGLCMAPEYEAGDVVLVDTSGEPVEGAVVACAHEADDSCCLRRWCVSGDHVALTANNPAHPPRIMPASKARKAIRGVVAGLCWRKARVLAPPPPNSSDDRTGRQIGDKSVTATTPPNANPL